MIRKYINKGIKLLFAVVVMLIIVTLALLFEFRGNTTDILIGIAITGVLTLILLMLIKIYPNS